MTVAEIDSLKFGYVAFERNFCQELERGSLDNGTAVDKVGARKGVVICFGVSPGSSVAVVYLIYLVFYFKEPVICVIAGSDVGIFKVRGD